MNKISVEACCWKYFSRLVVPFLCLLKYFCGMLLGFHLNLKEISLRCRLPKKFSENSLLAAIFSLACC